MRMSRVFSGHSISAALCAQCGAKLACWLGAHHKHDHDCVALYYHRKGKGSLCFVHEYMDSLIDTILD